MSLPPSKRRKTDNSNVLFKPFKSPMKLPQPVPELQSNAELSSTSTAVAATTQLGQKTTLKRGLSVKKSQVEGSASSIPVDSPKAELISLRREESRLRSRMIKLQSELDQIKQAQKIEDSNHDQELQGLIKLWKSTSQQAAEEIYSIFRDKVNALGGVRRWREMEKARKENTFSGWDTEERRLEPDEDCEDEGGNEDEPVETEADIAESSTSEEPDTFSMDVMLDYLGIKPGKIGYDIENQRWGI